MFILDTVLLAPLHMTVWAARQVQRAIEQEREQEPELISAQLSELYMQLDTGRITEEEFAAREKELLDRFDQLKATQKEQPPRS